MGLFYSEGVYSGGAIDIKKHIILRSQYVSFYLLI